MELHDQFFESQIFGRSVARLDCTAEDAVDLPAFLDSAAADGAWLISCRATDPALGAGLAAAGFEHVETLVTYERPIAIDEIPETSSAIEIELARPADAEACAEIARTAFTSDRLHADPRLPREAADEMKAKWIRNSIGGRADAVVVLREADHVIGFNACMRPDPDTALIDLIAVSPAAQGKGVGRRLVVDSLRHYADTANRMRVGTQAKNDRSCRLYESLGFQEVSRADTYHWVAR